MFGSFIFLATCAVILACVSLIFRPPYAAYLRYAAGAAAGLSGLALLFASLTQVPASNVGIQVRFGQVLAETLPEGLHIVPPWVRVVPMYMAQQTVTASKADAASQDLQSVHADVNVAFSVKPGQPRDLFVMNPTLSYPDLLVAPATQEVFKSVIARYTAEQLVTQRQQVSEAMLKAMQAKLAPYHLQVQAINLQNFGFSKSFNASIEEKVVASQKAETAKRNLERVKSEAEARIAQAEGEAKAIAIQAAAIEKQGGDKYVQLQALARWNGVLPSTVGGAIPFINIKPNP